MPRIEIRKFKKADENDIINICYRTGYMGEDLTGKNLFNDVKLFGYIFCLYYPYYEPEHCFVAVDEDASDKVVGYIIGTPDSKRQELQFAFKMGWRIVLRLIFVTFWRYPGTFRFLIDFALRIGIKYISTSFEYGPKNLYNKYPAHLHINILSEYQRYGIGSRLIEKFEQHMKENKVHGIHLRTSNNNHKALPFYIKHGYNKIYEDDITFWKNISDYKNIIFAKEL